MALPRMIHVRQKFEAPQVNNVAAEVESQLQRLDLAQKIKPGQSIAITAGSRGIANIAEITRAMVTHCQNCLLYTSPSPRD